MRSILEPILVLALSASLASLYGCGEEEVAGSTLYNIEAKDPAPAHEAGTHTVICGCIVEEVGHCSELVDVDGKYVPLQFPEGMDMGAMPFCGKGELRATIDGAVEGETFVAQTFALVE